jgi:hypothetical protein
VHVVQSTQPWEAGISGTHGGSEIQFPHLYDGGNDAQLVRSHKG